MENNLVVVRTASGGLAPRIRIDPDILPKVQEFLARDLSEFQACQIKCVMAEYDVSQSAPIVRRWYKNGYDSFFGGLLSVLTGWHFIRGRYRPLYRANSRGLRLIAEHADPHKAYASLMS